MDAKTGITILMLILLLGITAYLKKEKIESFGIVDKIKDLADISPAPSKEYNIGISYHGNGKLSGKGILEGEAVFYFPEKTKLGESIMAERWVKMNITKARFSINEGIAVNGKANRIELENGIINGSFMINFHAEFFDVNGHGDLSINNTDGLAEIGDISLKPEWLEIRNFAGRIQWMDNRSISGKAGLVKAGKGSIIYSAEEK